MASPVSAEVEAFLFAAEGLEEKASQALREADPEVQKAVLARGDLTGARNPSAALLGRIRKATGGGGGATVNVDAFIAENSPLDERAQEALRTAPGWVQEGVVAGGEVTNARNPSAALISRINSVQTGGGGWGGDPWGGAWGGKGGWGAADPWTVGFQMGFGGKGWDKGWGKGWGGGGGSWGGGGGGGGSWGETPARKGPVTLGSAGTVHYLTVPPTSALVQKGMSAEVVAVEYDKTNTVFQSAAHILGDLLDAEPKEVCSFDFDPDAAVFPEVAQAWTNAGNEQSCFMISQCPSMGKWAVGVAPGWKNAERAGKLALAVAIAHGTPQLQMLFNTFPEFHDFCKSAGLVEGAQPQSAGLVWSPPEATLMAGMVKPATWEAPCPEVMWLTVDPTSRIMQEGMPAECPAVGWTKELQKYFSNSTNILQELVVAGGLSVEDVSITHDADWAEYPDIGPLVQAASGEESCYAIATCASAAKWAVGVGSNWKARETAAKLALSIAIVVGDADKVAELSKTYPEFGRLAKRNGLSGGPPPEKKPKLVGLL